MREAMAKAEVGDDVYGEDPTVNRLQEMAAERLGKQAALLVPSGTMANQAALRAQTQPGDAAIAGEDAHVQLYESAAAAAISGVQFTTAGRGGLFTASDVESCVYPSDSHYPRTRIVCLENTHNRSGGRVFPFDEVRAIVETASARGLALHLDGARLFNAEAATGIPAARWAEGFDSVSFCLSKGLGAPVGSLVAGSSGLIGRVHRARKMLGGGMRQAGILAAAGIYALDHGVARLEQDHCNARRLADALRGADGIELLAEPETNMVLVRVADAEAFVSRAARGGVRVGAMGPKDVRAVTHLDVTSDDIDAAAEILRTAA